MKKIISIFVILLYSITFYGQWTKNTSENTLVADSEGGDVKAIGTSDGQTYVVFWKSVPSPDFYELRVQLLDTDGTQLFGADGLLVSDAIPMSSFTVLWSITIDSDDNLYIGATGTEDSSAFAFKIDADGNQLWGNEGVALGTGNMVKILPLADGSAIASWFPAPQALMQKIDTDGNFVWDTPVIVDDGGTPTAPADMFELSDGGFVMVFHEVLTGINSFLHAQRYNSDGIAQWGAPVQLADRTSQFNKSYTGTQDGDIVYYGYSVSSGLRFDSFLQRINPDGTIPWGINGADFDVDETDYEINTQISFSEGADHVWSICTYTDSSQNLYGEYIQKFDKATGARQFTDNAKELYALSDQPNVHTGQFQLLNNQPFFLIKSGLDTGASPVTLHVLYLDENGDFMWDDETKPVATHQASKSRIQFTQPVNGQSVAVFVEEKSTDNFPMIYAQNSVGEDLSASGFENELPVYYNNPFGNQLSVQSNETIDRIEIFNLLGQQIINQKVNQQNTTIDSTDWKSGMYIMNITSQKGNHKSYKLIR